MRCADVLGRLWREVAGEPLDPDEVYRVVTNDFLAGGQDGWTTFADGTNRWNTYYDMQEGFVEYIKMLEVIDAEDIPMDRIIQLDHVVTLLHTNDTHGVWPETYYYGTLRALPSWHRRSRPSGLRTPIPCCWMPATPSRVTPLPSTFVTPIPIPLPAG